jgi:hypothetical protein
VVNSAARENHLDILRWLIDTGCPHNVHEACMIAAEAGYVDMLQYLSSLEVTSDAALMTRMLNVAGANGHLAAAQWLHAQGAAWPTILYYELAEDNTCEYWSGETLAWARGQGCDSPTEPITEDDSDSEYESEHDEQYDMINLIWALLLQGM